MPITPRLPRGFTLIELLISIGIFLVITGTVIMSFASGKYRDELTSTGSLVQATVREAQSLTTAGATVRCPLLPPADPPAAPVGGYGVYLNQVVGQVPEMVLFADCESANTPLRFDTMPADCGAGCDDVVVRRVTLPERVSLGTVLPGAPLDVVFSPLTETVAINGTASYSGEATAEFSHAKSGRRLTVKVNAFTGQVFVTQPQ